VGWAYQSLGRHASNNGDFQQSCVYYEKAVATHEAIGLYFYIPSNYAYASIAAGLQKDAQSVRRYRILALDWADNIGINSMKPYILRHVGYAALFAGLYDLAEQDFSQYFQLTENSDHDSNTFARSLFAELELARNNIPAAQSHLQFALTSITSTTPTTLKIACISPSVQLMTITGKTSRAIELVSLVLNIPAADVATRYTCQLHADKLKTELPTSDFDAAWQRGQSFDIDTIIQELLTELDSNE
jgi:tetratricopeptide (TPR) repeat protein